MTAEKTNSMIIQMVQDYLKARKLKSMKDVYKGPQDELDEGWKLACEHDKIGWKCFTKGRISKGYVSIQKSWFKSNKRQ